MIRVLAAQRQAIERHGEETYPHECCGFLIGKREGEESRVLEVRRAGNAREDSPHNRYEIQPIEWGGVPISIEHPVVAPDTRCVHHLYKDVRAVPAEDYERIGQPPPE